MSHRYVDMLHTIAANVPDQERKRACRLGARALEQRGVCEFGLDEDGERHSRCGVGIYDDFCPTCGGLVLERVPTEDDDERA